MIVRPRHVVAVLSLDTSTSTRDRSRYLLKAELFSVIVVWYVEPELKKSGNPVHTHAFNEDLRSSFFPEEEDDMLRAGGGRRGRKSWNPPTSGDFREFAIGYRFDIFHAQNNGIFALDGDEDWSSAGHGEESQ